MVRFGYALIMTWLTTSSAMASAWTQPQGTARLALAWSSLSSPRQFAAGDAGALTGPLCPEPITAGQRSPYSCVTGGMFTAHQVTLTTSTGVLPWLTVDADVPFVVASSFTDDNGTFSARGLGDVRLGARVGRTWDRVALSGVAIAQAPTGPRNFQDREVPIGQGQWDLTLGARVGISAWPHGWLEMHHAMRLRLANRQTGINPGEEWVGEVGGGWTPFEHGGFLGRAEWIWAGQDRSVFGLNAPGRKLLQARTGVFVQTKRWWVDVGVAVPLAGQAWASAPVWQGSVAYTVGQRAN